jgi:DNA-binding NtrC family response regulator
LRERRRDILPLAATLLDRIGRQLGYANLEVDDGAKKLLIEADWPGNVREPANALERAAILSGGKRITKQHFSEIFCDPDPRALRK